MNKLLGKGRKPAVQPAQDAPRVLVVDDSHDVRTIVRLMISPLGVNVIEADNGRKALDLLRAESVDVVVSDLVMPEMSGMMLLHSMLEQGFHIPFILISGHADKDSAIQALRLGAFDYLEKPVDEEDLRAVLSEAISIGKEQRKLIGSMQRSGSGLAGDGGDPRAEIYIMKMRTLRYREEATRERAEENQKSETASGHKTWQDLREMFVSEAESQLVFCEASFDALQRDEDTERETAFVARVIQAVRLAGEALRVNDIAELAWSIEEVFAVYRDAPDALRASLPLLREATRKLKQKVSALDDQETITLQRRLKLAAAAAAPTSLTSASRKVG